MPHLSVNGRTIAISASMWYILQGSIPLVWYDVKSNTLNIGIQGNRLEASCFLATKPISVKSTGVVDFV